MIDLRVLPDAAENVCQTNHELAFPTATNNPRLLLYLCRLVFISLV